MVGGNEWTPPARELDAWLLERSGSKTVSVVPTPAALQGPERAIATARRHFKHLGASVTQVMVLEASDADDPKMAGVLEDSPFIYISGGNPRRTVKVLAGSPVWDAILASWNAGAVLAGSSAGAMILCRRMLVPRWKVPAEGLGLLEDKLVLPHHNAWIRRVGKVTRSPAARGLEVIGVDECTGLVLDGGDCLVLGAGAVTAYRDGEAAWMRRAPSIFTGC